MLTVFPNPPLLPPPMFGNQKCQPSLFETRTTENPRPISEKPWFLLQPHAGGTPKSIPENDYSKWMKVNQFNLSKTDLWLNHTPMAEWYSPLYFVHAFWSIHHHFICLVIDDFHYNLPIPLRNTTCMKYHWQSTKDPETYYNKRHEKQIIL